MALRNLPKQGEAVSKKVFLSSFLFYIFTKIIYQRK
jgi:hypothetical protein